MWDDMQDRSHLLFRDNIGNLRNRLALEVVENPADLKWPKSAKDASDNSRIEAAGMVANFALFFLHLTLKSTGYCVPRAALDTYICTRIRSE